jgi:hypothetical protein
VSGHKDFLDHPLSNLPAAIPEAGSCRIRR